MVKVRGFGLVCLTEDAHHGFPDFKGSGSFRSILGPKTILRLVPGHVGRLKRGGP